MFIYEIKDKLSCNWNEECSAVVDTWNTYDVSLEEFRKAVLVEGVNHAKANGGVAWIVDSSSADGVFSQEIQDFIISDIFPGFVKIGIKYFITIVSGATPLTKMTVKQYSAATGPLGLKLVELNNVDDALLWLKENG